MAGKSAIEWTTSTWNPVTGCDRVSPGCDHCYALTLATRLKAMGNPRYIKDGSPRTSGPGFGVSLHEDQLTLPLRWRQPRTIFVNSMSDLFHDEVPDVFVAKVFAVMAACPEHTFQVLTKRPRRMSYLVPKLLDLMDQLQPSEHNGRLIDVVIDEWPLPNVWLGTSVENQKWADQRIPLLLETPASIRFLSCEPLIDDIRDAVSWRPTSRGLLRPDWVIVGGESGPAARPMNIEWARTIRDECVDAGVPYFFKQWGGRTPKAGGRELDGRTWDQMPHMQPIERLFA